MGKPHRGTVVGSSCHAWVSWEELSQSDSRCMIEQAPRAPCCIGHVRLPCTLAAVVRLTPMTESRSTSICDSKSKLVGVLVHLCASAVLSRTSIMDKVFWLRLCNSSLNRSLGELMLSNLSTGALAVSGAHRNFCLRTHFQVATKCDKIRR